MTQRMHTIPGRIRLTCGAALWHRPAQESSPIRRARPTTLGRPTRRGTDGEEREQGADRLAGSACRGARRARERPPTIAAQLPARPGVVDRAARHARRDVDAEAFEAELSYYLVHQMGAFNSPVWFNCGLWHEYEIKGSGGNWAVDFATGTAYQTGDAYSRPQVSACFIQSCNDDLESIFNLVHDEARVFKYGSGSGTNFSKLRGKMERLSGGGTSSGLMSFLEVLDRAAGATKSGGITRRAAKMVVVDADHPEIRDFVQWKAREEKKVQALIAGGYASDFNGDAYRTVSGQNANNSVRITDRFIEAVNKDAVWETTTRTTDEVVERLSARELWREMAEAAWKCADPGLQFDDTTNKWHTCKATDRIYASNPCSEFVFLDDTACNLASLNLLKFLKEPDGSAGGRAGGGGIGGKTEEFDVEGY